MTDKIPAKEVNHLVADLVKYGKQLVAETEKPNVITLEQFQPYIPLFTADMERYKTDDVYREEITKLGKSWKRDLGINLFQPVIVVASKSDNTELYHLDRVFTRIKSDQVSADQTNRALVPSNIPVTSTYTRNELLFQATLHDVMLANSTPEQLNYFNKVKEESAAIARKFLEKTASPEMRKAYAEKKEAEDAQVSNNDDFYLDDDD